jgi:hypothetical protein
MIILAQVTSDVPLKYLPPWIYGFIIFLGMVWLILAVIGQLKKQFSRRPPIDDDLKKLRSEIYHAKNSVRKEVAMLISTESKRISELEQEFKDMQMDRARKWVELKEQFHELEKTLAFIRGKFEQEEKS